MAHSIESLTERVDDIARTLSPVMARIGRLQLNCDKHGTYLANGVRLRTRDIWDKCPGCVADQQAIDRAVKEALAAERARVDFEAKIESAAIPVRFIGKTLNNFRAESEAQRYAATVARDYIENFDQQAKKGAGLIFSGMPGTGKSHLAAAILQGILPRHVGLYVTAMQAIRMVRETWRRDSERSEREVLRIFGDVPLLVMDEIGVQYGTDGEQTVLFDILDRRYRDMKPTILLTNQDKAGLKQFIGERAYDRLTETCRWVPFDWQSYRAQARKEAA